MPGGEPFVDYYKILEVEPNCSARMLETAFHRLAKLYHPDHTDAPDVEGLTAIIEAHRALSDSEKRVEYDLVYSQHTGFSFAESDDSFNNELSALSDAEIHEKLLRFLYKKRRESAQDAGVGRYFVQQEVKCSDEHFEFHLWYLKSKGLIVTTEQGTLAITIEGVDHVIAMSRSIAKERLQIAQVNNLQDQKPS